MSEGTPTTMTDIALIVSRLNDMRNITSTLGEQLDEARAIESGIRDELRSAMAEQCIKTYEGSGLGITRRVTNSVVIEDMDAFVETLKEADLYDVCLAPPKIDTKSAIKRAKEHDLPGLVTKTTETLVVTPKQAA